MDLHIVNWARWMSKAQEHENTGSKRIENRSGFRGKMGRRVLQCRLISFGLLISSISMTGSPAGAAAINPRAMGSIPCAWSVPIQGQDHRLDVPATIELLQANHFTCYVQPIEEKAPMSFEDFKRLLPAAQRSGISIWPVLIPHTEGASLPYREDFVRWMGELAHLSLEYSVLRGVNIDDTDAGGNERMFTRDYVCRIYRTKQKINPKLLFIPTVYDLDSQEADRFAGCVDGVWLWWTNIEQNNGLRAFLEDSRRVVRNRFPVYAGVYAHSTSWHKEGSPTPKILKESLTLGCTYSDGVIIWQLPLTTDSASNPMLPVASEFTAQGESPLAGKCGQGLHE
jgi:hypothetical protein